MSGAGLQDFIGYSAACWPMVEQCIHIFGVMSADYPVVVFADGKD